MKSCRRLSSLYISYLGLSDPLVDTQVVAYLRGLAAAGHRIHLLTFETVRLTRTRRRQLRGSLAAEGIHWHGLRYHKRPSLPATLYDTLAGAAFIALLSRIYRLDVVHARTHVPAAMALIARLTSRKPPALVFDIRGLMVEEYEEAGRWRPGGIPSRITRAVQNGAIRRARAIVILTEKARDALFDDDRRRVVQVIPCCANIDQIEIGRSHRESVRESLGLEGSTVMVYVGKFPDWSLPAAMADFFAIASQMIKRLHFLILTQADGETIRRELARNLVDPGSYTITRVPAEEVGVHLAASDFAVTFIAPKPSTIGQSPTKVGEYLASGLPVVHSAGIGDLDDLISAEVGVRVPEHSAEAHRAAAQALLALLADPGTPARARTTAERTLSLERIGIPRYLALYDQLAQSLNGANQGSR